MNSFLKILILLIVSMINCYSKDKSDPMGNTVLIYKETDEQIETIANIYVYLNNSADFQINSASINSPLSIMFDVFSASKKDKSGTSSRYMMNVNPVPDGFDAKLKLQSYSFHGSNGKQGHAHPSGKELVDEELSNFVIDYYLKNKEKIPHSASDIDVSKWNPLFTLYKNPSNQGHVLNFRITNVRQEPAQVEIECELLSFNNTLLDGKLNAYNISKFHFIFREGYNQYFPENKEFYAKWKLLSAKNYTNQGSNVEAVVYSEA